MTSYGWMLVRFIHSMFPISGITLASVYGFTFGTRLHNISPLLSIKDSDAARWAIGAQVYDWEGGNWIAITLEEFNSL